MSLFLEVIVKARSGTKNCKSKHRLEFELIIAVASNCFKSANVQIEIQISFQFTLSRFYKYSLVTRTGNS